MVALAPLMALVLCYSVLADESRDVPKTQEKGQVSLVSTAVRCLTVEAGTSRSASATVQLKWEGQVEKAFLVLAIAGSERPHSIYVNNYPVGNVPIQPSGRPCQADFIYEIPVPTDILVNGENKIVLTNDADVSDSWAAADLHLEIYGVLSGPPEASLRASSLPSGDLTAAAAITGSVILTSSYDGVSHTVWYQDVPSGYTGPRPLLIGIHGYGGSGEDLINSSMAAEAEERGWLMAAPDMHARSAGINSGRYAFAWPGAQHDILDAIEYMVTNYDVDRSRIYIIGGSMGGQTAAVMAAKYPDVFAAAVPWMPITNLATWYYELPSSQNVIKKRLRQETGYPSCDPDVDTDDVTGCGTPQSGDPNTLFEYQRRSAIEMPQNSRLVPLKMWHDVQDELVPIHHSRDLRDAINRQHPPIEVILVEVDENSCPEFYNHCLSPDSDEVFDYLAGFTLSSQPPPSATIRTDESKSYYWLNLVQTGSDHWSEIQTTYDAVQATVTATVSDTQPLTAAFNLGSTPTTGRVTEQPGMGLPATSYLVSGGGNYKLEDYTSGYLTTPLTITGQFSLTISAITVEVSAEPSTISPGQVTTITAVVRDHLGKPAPDGTSVRFFTTNGTFPNTSSVYTTTTAGGQADAVLTIDSAGDRVEITASVGSVVGSTLVDAIQIVYLPFVTSNR